MICNNNIIIIQNEHRSTRKDQSTHSFCVCYVKFKSMFQTNLVGFLIFLLLRLRFELALALDTCSVGSLIVCISLVGSCEKSSFVFFSLTGESSSSITTCGWYRFVHLAGVK